jgi:hypothetical protein
VLFLLTHAREVEPDATDTKVIGVFASRTHAERAQLQLTEVEGFMDHPDCFVIEVLPLDESVYDFEESGIADLVSQFAAVTLSPSSTGDTERMSAELRRLIGLGSPAVYNLIAEIHEQSFSPEHREKLETDIIALWRPTAVRIFSRTRVSRTELETIAADFWTYRRRDYPTAPAWDDAEYSAWRVLRDAHRQVLTMDGFDDSTVTEMMSTLRDAAADARELAYLDHGPVSVWA